MLAYDSDCMINLYKIVNSSVDSSLQSNRNRTFYLQAEEAWHTILSPFFVRVVACCLVAVLTHYCYNWYQKLKSKFHHGWKIYLSKFCTPIYRWLANGGCVNDWEAYAAMLAFQAKLIATSNRNGWGEQLFLCILCVTLGFSLLVVMFRVRLRY